MWVARNKNGIIWIFTEKPIRFETDGSWVSRVIPKTTYCSVSYHTKIGELNKKQFPELKWEDEPIEVELKAIPKAKPISQLWEEWRFTNEWKANCQYTTFDQFLIDRGIKYTVE